MIKFTERKSTEDNSIEFWYNKKMFDLKINTELMESYTCLSSTLLKKYIVDDNWYHCVTIIDNKSMKWYING